MTTKLFTAQEATSLTKDYFDNVLFNELIEDVNKTVKVDALKGKTETTIYLRWFIDKGITINHCYKLKHLLVNAGYDVLSFVPHESITFSWQE